MRTFIFIILFFVTCIGYSQEQQKKGLQTINRESAEAYIGFLASDALEGRQAGYRGGHVASEYIKSELVRIGVEKMSDSYFQNFVAVGKITGNKRIRYFVNPDSVGKHRINPEYDVLNMRNVIGCIEGRNKNEVVIVGAHYDHLGVDESLGGDKIYNGADDNASGVSAVLQIAKAFVASGKKPERTILFAFWDGEEIGRLGSEYFMQTYPVGNSEKKIRGYLNFDMIGRNADESQPEHVVYFYTESQPIFGQWLKDDIENYNLSLKPDYRPWDKPLGGSDNGSFAKRDIPIIWYHTDGHSDYHKPGDEVEKINWDKLIEITKAAFLNMWNMANNENF